MYYSLNLISRYRMQQFNIYQGAMFESILNENFE